MQPERLQLPHLLAVAFMAACSGPADPAPPPAPDAALFFSAQRAIKTGLVDYGHHSRNEDYQAFIAEHFDYVVSGDPQLDFDRFKSVNPGILLFSYFDSQLLAPDLPAPASEEAYQHAGASPADALDPTKRLGKIEYGTFWYVMNPGNAAWQAHSLGRIQEVLDTGFDGVHIDNVFAHLMHEDHFNPGEPLLIGQPDGYAEFSTVPAWYDPQSSHDGWRSYLSFLSQSLDEKVVFNGINDLAEGLQPIDPAYHPIHYLDVCDGSAQEGFVYNGHWVDDPDGGFYGDEYWEAIVDVLIRVASDKPHGVVSYGDPNYWRGRIYAYASFLIGFDPDGAAAFSYTADEFTLTYLPEWDLNLGRPLDTHPSVQGYRDGTIDLFTRRFEHALVIVNPHGSSSGPVPLDGEYSLLTQAGEVEVIPLDGEIKTALGERSQLRFETVSSVELEGYSAVILMR